MAGCIRSLVTCSQNVFLSMRRRERLEPNTAGIGPGLPPGFLLDLRVGATCRSLALFKCLGKSKSQTEMRGAFKSFNSLSLYDLHICLEISTD